MGPKPEYLPAVTYLSHLSFIFNLIFMSGRLQNRASFSFTYLHQNIIIYILIGSPYHRCRIVCYLTRLFCLSLHLTRFIDCPSTKFRGIGLESSVLFAQEGCHVVLSDVNIDGAKKGAEIIATRYPNVKAIAIKCDVSREQDIKAAVDTAVKEFGRLDIMVRDYNLWTLISYGALTNFI